MSRSLCFNTSTEQVCLTVEPKITPPLQREIDEIEAQLLALRDPTEEQLREGYTRLLYYNAIARNPNINVRFAS